MGPQGPPGVIVNAYIQGAVPVFPDSVGVWSFLGPTVSVTIGAASNTVHVTSTATLGTTNLTGAVMDRFSVCHQLSGGGALIDHLNDFSSIRVPANTRIPITVSQRIAALVAGSTYNVGLCYQTSAGQAANWNSNQWINNRVLVLEN